MDTDEEQSAEHLDLTSKKKKKGKCKITKKGKQKINKRWIIITITVAIVMHLQCFYFWVAYQAKYIQINKNCEIKKIKPSMCLSNHLLPVHFHELTMTVTNDP